MNKTEVTEVTKIGDKMKKSGFWIFCVCIGLILLTGKTGITDTTGVTGITDALNELKTTHPNKAARIYEMMADGFVKEKDFSQAADFYRQALGLDPDNEGVLTKLADCYRNQKNPEQEIAIFRRLTSLYSNNPFYYQRLSGLLVKAGKAEEADGVYETLVENNPYSVEAFRRAAAYFAVNKDYIRAIARIEKAIQLDPNALSLRFQLGSVLSQAGKLDQAQAVYQEIIDSQHEAQIKENAINQLVILKKQHNKLSSYIVELEEKLNNNPDDINLLAVAACAYFIDGSSDKAAGTYKKIIKQLPFQRTNYNRLMEIYNNQARVDEVCGVLESMLKAWPEDLSLYHRLAQTYLKHGKGNMAVKTYKKALKIQPNNPNLLFGLGEVFLRQDKFSEAHKNLAICVSLEPRNTQYQEKLEIAKKGRQAQGIKEEKTAKPAGEKKPWWKRLFGW